MAHVAPDFTVFIHTGETRRRKRSRIECMPKTDSVTERTRALTTKTKLK
jgi:hypothetical protein